MYDFSWSDQIGFQVLPGSAETKILFLPLRGMNKEEAVQATESHLGTGRGNASLRLDSSPNKWSREVKRKKLDPGDIPGLLDHASPEASADPALDLTTLCQESI